MSCPLLLETRGCTVWAWHTLASYYQIMLSTLNKGQQFQTILTLLQSYCQTIITFSEFIPNNKDIFESYCQTILTFHCSYQTIMTLSHTYCQTLLTFSVFISNNTSSFQFQRVTAKQYPLFPNKQYWHFERVTTKKQYTFFRVFIMHYWHSSKSTHQML